MVKSGLEKIILKFNDGLQSCCCPVQNNLPRKAELAWQVSRYLWRPPWNFKIFFSRPLFTIIFKPKMVSNLCKFFSCIVGTRNLQCLSFLLYVLILLYVLFKKKNLNHFLPSFLSPKWCQISIRIFCVLSGTRNLQWSGSQ
jgi:hypothetical protein